MTVIIDYGVGNLFSLKSSLACIGEDCIVSGDRKIIEQADRIILPGVGAFADAAEKLKAKGLDELIKAEVTKGKYLLGICLGMQLLFDRSYEYGTTSGLGLISGEVIPIENIIPKGYKIPHIGWNSLKFSELSKSSGIFKYINDGDYVYFVHSYAAVNCNKNVLAQTEHGSLLTAAVQSERVFGMQFHPEKSGDTGLEILKAFCELK